MAISDALDPSGYGYAAAEADPAQSPVALEENKSKWRQFLSRFDDPNLRQAVLSTGIGLLRSPSYGQNSGDIIANALGSGVNTLQSLRNMDYAKQQAAQTRQDTQTQRRTENQQRQQQIDISSRGATTAEAAQRSTEANQQAIRENSTGVLNENIRHNQAEEEINRIRAEAERRRADAYSRVGAREPADVQKINMLAAQYMTEGMDETAARAKAVMIVDSSKGVSSPGEQAMGLYQLKLKNWSNDINNFGKQLTPEQSQQLQREAIDEVMKFAQFNQSQTGMPVPPNPQNPRQGTIDRTNQNSSPVGTVKNGYKKSKPGPDRDKTTWTKVNGNAK